MQNALVIGLIILLSSCSSKSSREKLSSFRYQDTHSGIVVIDRETKWEPDDTCRRLRYVKVKGHKIDSSFIGYQQAVVKLSNLSRRMYGTHAKIRDYTDSQLFAHIWFCSSDYGKK